MEERLFLKENKFLLIIILVSLLATIFVATNRYKIEAENKRVELTLDYQEVKDLANLTGKDVLSLLVKFKERGIVSVGGNEDTLLDLARAGKINCEVGRPATSKIVPFKITPGYTYLIISDSQLYHQLLRNLNLKWGEERIKTLKNKKNYFIEIEGGKKQLEGLGLGLPEDELRKLKRLGLKVIPRLKNYPQMTEKGMRVLLKDLTAGSTLIFLGEEVLGCKSLIPLVSKELKKRKLNFGLIEFGKQEGATQLSRLSLPQVIRVHSINEEEMKEIKPAGAAERMLRAVKERDIRLCYLRLFPFKYAGVDNLNLNLNYVENLRDRLERAGFEIGSAEAYSEFQTNPFLLYLICLGVLAAGVLLLKSLFKIKERIVALILIGGFFFCLLFFLFSPSFAGKFLALSAAIIFPVLALSTNRRSLTYSIPPTISAIVQFLATSLISLVGAALIVGLLGDLRFLLKADQFVGIKIAFFLPLFLIALIYLGDIFPGNKEKTKENLANFLSQSLRVWQVVLFGLLAVAILILITRSGNQPLIPVSSIELKVRHLLEEILFARPRTKEFLIGHPALILAYFLTLRKEIRFTTPLILIGAIGQLSMINTFCHIHTPLSFSILRTFNGIFLGIGVGVGVIVAYQLLISRKWEVRR